MQNRVDGVLERLIQSSSNVEAYKSYLAIYKDLQANPNHDYEKLIYCKFMILDYRCTLGLVTAEQVLRIIKQMQNDISIYATKQEAMPSLVLDIFTRLNNLSKTFEHPDAKVVLLLNYANFVVNYINCNDEFIYSTLLKSPNGGTAEKKEACLSKLIDELYLVKNDAIALVGVERFYTMLLIACMTITYVSYEMLDSLGVEIDQVDLIERLDVANNFESCHVIAQQAKKELPLQFHFDYLSLLGQLSRIKFAEQAEQIRKISKYMEEHKLEERVRDEEKSMLATSTSPEATQDIKRKYQQYRVSLAVHQYAKPTLFTIYKAPQKVTKQDISGPSCGL